MLFFNFNFQVLYLCFNYESISHISFPEENCFKYRKSSVSRMRIKGSRKKSKGRLILRRLQSTDWIKYAYYLVFDLFYHRIVYIYICMYHRLMLIIYGQTHMVYARNLVIAGSHQSEHWSWVPMQYDTSR